MFEPLEHCLHNIEGMTVEQHHLMCLGVLALCYEHAPDHLRAAIMEGLQAAKLMGANIEPENTKRGLALCLSQ